MKKHNFIRTAIMTTVHVTVASMNDSKIQCVRAAFANFLQKEGSPLRPESILVDGLSGVPSGVSEQPMGFDETMLGAINRANACRAKFLQQQQQQHQEQEQQQNKNNNEKQHFYVGVESGIIISGLDKKTCYDFCACAVVDGQTQECFTGMSCGFALPPRVGDKFIDESNKETFHEYNPSFAAGGFEPDPTGPGVLSQLSGGHTTRGGQMQSGVEMALVACFNKAYRK